MRRGHAVVEGFRYFSTLCLYFQGQYQAVMGFNLVNKKDSTYFIYFLMLISKNHQNKKVSIYFNFGKLARSRFIHILLRLRTDDDRFNPRSGTSQTSGMSSLKAAWVELNCLRFVVARPCTNKTSFFSQTMSAAPLNKLQTTLC